MLGETVGDVRRLEEAEMLRQQSAASGNVVGDIDIVDEDGIRGAPCVGESLLLSNDYEHEDGEEKKDGEEKEDGEEEDGPPSLRMDCHSGEGHHRRRGCNLVEKRRELRSVISARSRTIDKGVAPSSEDHPYHHQRASAAMNGSSGNPTYGRRSRLTEPRSEGAAGNSQKRRRNNVPRRDKKTSRGPNAGRIHDLSRETIEGALQLLKVSDGDKFDCLVNTMQSLGETNVQVFERIIFYCQVELCQEVLGETLEIERNGGMPVLEGDRRRTPGGTYIYLLKQRLPKDVTKVIWEEQARSHKLHRREHKKKLKNATQLDLEVEAVVKNGNSQRMKLMELGLVERAHSLADKFSNRTTDQPRVADDTGPRPKGRGDSRKRRHKQQQQQQQLQSFRDLDNPSSKSGGAKSRIGKTINYKGDGENLSRRPIVSYDDVEGFHQPDDMQDDVQMEIS